VSRLRHGTLNRGAHAEPLVRPVERPNIRDAERGQIWISTAHLVSLHAADVVYWRQFASHGAADRTQRVADLLGKIKVARTTTTQKQQRRQGLTEHRNNRTHSPLKL
jgi:hypothetical protein